LYSFNCNERQRFSIVIAAVVVVGAALSPRVDERFEKRSPLLSKQRVRRLEFFHDAVVQHEDAVTVHYRVYPVFMLVRVCACMCVVVCVYIRGGG